ncbi:hypothetical protein BX661DRAFT_56121 [Kickxella alabastrina]|uniref:uncharacterized protein n=1 Tax=Kickxella alabastrina TaxID=61397 RepID=UPI00221FD26F|nr:uncharacterized protein BX661DRAFT_56121 [Kickxella alabastrina]KAI7823469.1 hypothetical protein BX661DRAFT_56121 [Kickxella alabastrina]
MLLQSQSQGKLAAARSPTVNRTHSGVNHGGSSWDDLGSKQSTTMQQQMLVERAEQMKWWYRDPQGSIQGPFSATNMQDWFSADYFPADLQVCHEGSAGFEALSSLVARIGNPQSVFIFAALVFITQSIQQRSGINTPATPAAMSRAPSAIQLTMLDADVNVSAAATAAGTSSAGALDNLQQDVRNMSNGVNAPFSASASMFGGGAPSGDINTARSSASGTPSAGAGTSAAATQAAQLSLLLNEQFLLVSAINDRQHTLSRFKSSCSRAWPS